MHSYLHLTPLGYTQRMPVLLWRYILTVLLSISSRKWKQPINQSMDNKHVVYTQKRTYSDIKKN